MTTHEVLEDVGDEMAALCRQLAEKDGEHRTPLLTVVDRWQAVKMRPEKHAWVEDTPARRRRRRVIEPLPPIVQTASYDPSADDDTSLEQRLGGIPVTPRQWEVLRFIEAYRKHHPYNPSMAEIGQALQVSRVTVFEHLRALVAKGVLRCHGRHGARSYVWACRPLKAGAA